MSTEDELSSAYKQGWKDAHEHLAEDGIWPAEWPKPIPVGARLPDDGQFALVFFGGDWDVACYEKYNWVFSYPADEHNVHDANGHYCAFKSWALGPDCEVTHWLPLPPKPE